MSEAKEENRPPHGHGERSEVRDAGEKAAKDVLAQPAPGAGSQAVMLGEGADWVGSEGDAPPPQHLLGSALP